MSIIKQVIKYMVRGLPSGLAYQKAELDIQEQQDLRSKLTQRTRLMRNKKSSNKSLLTAIPVGTKVRMVNCLEAENPKYQHDWVTKSDPWEASGSLLVLLEGFRGGFSLDKLELVDKK